MVLHWSPRLKTGEGGKRDSGQGAPLGGERLQEAEWTEIELWGEGLRGLPEGWVGGVVLHPAVEAVVSFRQHSPALPFSI